MTEAFWSSDWLTQNANRAYPLDDEADGRDTTGSLSLPQDLLVDLIFNVHASAYTDPSLFHIAAVTSYSSGVVISIGYNNALIASTSVASSTFTRNKSYTLSGQGDFEDSVGAIVIGSLDSIMALPAGSWEFGVADARLSPSAIRPGLRNVSSIRVVQGADVSEKLQGDIAFESGLNCRLRVVTISGVQTIYIDFISGEGTVETCDCDSMPEDAPAIRTINGIPPNSSGDFTFQGSICVAMSAILNGLQIDDVCSEPCCGCEELEVVLDALEGLNGQIYTLDNFVNSLDGSITQLLENVIASKVSDIPS